MRAPAPAALLARAALLALMLVLVLAAGKAAAQPPDGDLIARGKYLALAGDCTACHTIDAAKPMAGGYAVPTPFGTIYTPNITPDKDTGIGNWSDDDFVRALQRGIARDGSQLYPAFPYDSFTLLSRDDILAIKAYLFSLKPIHEVVPVNHLAFPFNQRWIMWFWKQINFRDARFQPTPGKSAEWNRGAYLVQALEHCGTCHTPRNLTMGMKTSRFLAGGGVGAWQAFNITPDKVSGIGGWSEADLLGYLTAGVAPGKAWAAGPMGEAVEHSLTHLTDADRRAIVTYVRDQAPISGNDPRPRFDYGRPAAYDPALRGSTGITENTTAATGSELYSGNCASCHGDAGAGSGDGYYPPLLHNTAVGAPAANNLVMVILNGVRRQAAGKLAFMPAFGNLDDDAVASLVNYVERQFGDPAVRVEPGDIAAFRTPAGPSPPYGRIALWAGIAIAAVFVAVVLALLLRRRHRRQPPGWTAPA